MLFIVQVMVKKKLVHSTNYRPIYGAEHLKIHPVSAETEIESHKKVEDFYKQKPGEWKVRIVDSEPLIS